MKKLFIALLSFYFILNDSICFSQTTVSTENEKSKYGVFGQFNLNQHYADFHALPGVPNSSPNFHSGHGTGASLGLFYELQLYRQASLSLRAGYSNYSAILSQTEPTVIAVNAVATPGLFEHTIDATLSSVGIEPLVQFYLTDNLSILAGPRIAFVITKTFSQKEVLVEPANEGVFVDTGSRIRNIASGDIPDALTIQASLMGGVSYELPLNPDRTFFASPEVFYSLGLVPVVNGLRWRADQFRFGIAFRYQSQKEIPIPPSVPSPLPKIPVLAVDMNAIGLQRDGTMIESPTLRVEEFISTQMTPLLNYIFFDQNSPVIPDRYHTLSHSQTEDFKITKRTGNEPFSIYYDMLNIIGSRMKQFPNAALTIVGCNADVHDEQENLNLSKQRASAVVSYLRDVWEIPETQIKIQIRNLPDKPTKSSDTDGIEENRRVEIYSDTWEILNPVTITDTLRVVTPLTVRFIPHVISEAGIHDWSLRISQQNRTLQTFEDVDTLPALIDWKIDAQTISPTTANIEYALQVNDRIQQTVTAPSRSISIDHITVQKKRQERIADKEIDRYNLILFDFDKNDLSEFNKKISEFIRERISAHASVTITGYTDRIGDAVYNQRLSEERAKTTERALKIKDSFVYGKGKESPLFDNNLPEGRCYNRTVEIIVETPVGR